MSFLIKQKLPLFTPSEGKGSAKSQKGSAKSQRSSQNDVDWASLKKNRIYLFSIKQKGKEEMEGKYLGNIRADSLTPSTKPPNSDGNTTKDNIDGKLAKINETLNALNAEIRQAVDSYNMALDAEPKLSDYRMRNLLAIVKILKQKRKELKKQRKKLNKQRKKNLEQRTQILKKPKLFMSSS